MEGNSRTGSGNAFDRARDAMLGIESGWWQALTTLQLEEVEFGESEFIELGDGNCVVGGMVLERRTLSLRKAGEDALFRYRVTRPVMTRFSALPLDLLERIARDVLAQSDAAWREANLEVAIAAARNFDIDEARQTAREILGTGASDEEVEELALQMRLPDALTEGGEEAARFFDELISVVTIVEDDDGNVEVLDDGADLESEATLGLDEWDFYSPEELAELDGPETDAAYAFRILRLCKAIRERPATAVQLALQLGAVTREWELWRENEEFIRAGRARFAQQIRSSRSRPERAWMAAVRDDLANGRIGANAAQYARNFKRRRRDLQPPSVERIRNFVSELKRQGDANEGVTPAGHS